MIDEIFGILDKPRQSLWNMLEGWGNILTGNGSGNDVLIGLPGDLGAFAGGALAGTGFGIPLALLGGALTGGALQSLPFAREAATGADVMKNLDIDPNSTGGFLGGLLTQLAGDPLTYLGGSAIQALRRAGSGARGAASGITNEAAEAITKRLGQVEDSYIPVPSAQPSSSALDSAFTPTVSGNPTPFAPTATRVSGNPTPVGGSTVSPVPTASGPTTTRYVLERNLPDPPSMNALDAQNRAAIWDMGVPEIPIIPPEPNTFPLIYPNGKELGMAPFNGQSAINFIEDSFPGMSALERKLQSGISMPDSMPVPSMIRDDAALATYGVRADRFPEILPQPEAYQFAKKSPEDVRRLRAYLGELSPSRAEPGLYAGNDARVPEWMRLRAENPTPALGPNMDIGRTFTRFDDTGPVVGMEQMVFDQSRPQLLNMLNQMTGEGVLKEFPVFGSTLNYGDNVFSPAGKTNVWDKTVSPELLGYTLDFPTPALKNWQRLVAKSPGGEDAFRDAYMQSRGMNMEDAYSLAREQLANNPSLSSIIGTPPPMPSFIEQGGGLLDNINMPGLDQAIGMRVIEPKMIQVIGPDGLPRVIQSATGFQPPSKTAMNFSRESSPSLEGLTTTRPAGYDRDLIRKRPTADKPAGAFGNIEEYRMLEKMMDQNPDIGRMVQMMIEQGNVEAIPNLIRFFS